VPGKRACRTSGFSLHTDPRLGKLCLLQPSSARCQPSARMCAHPSKTAAPSSRLSCFCRGGLNPPSCLLSLPFCVIPKRTVKFAEGSQRMPYPNCMSKGDLSQRLASRFNILATAPTCSVGVAGFSVIPRPAAPLRMAPRDLLVEGPARPAALTVSRSAPAPMSWIGAFPEATPNLEG
jgi:hypothetical protein